MDGPTWWNHFVYPDVPGASLKQAIFGYRRVKMKRIPRFTSVCSGDAGIWAEGIPRIAQLGRVDAGVAARPRRK
ncbi:hypothetical protein [Corynebacterium sputi]|uniref:hypothetical protein n=1 Tax=Corynebacterium sputi TaxID=489915 RepID=UPI0012EB1754|nr:hypothetical protein [Corynebacterium sputi]